MEKKFYSFKEIVESLPKKKNSRSSLWVKLVVRKISFVFTFLFVNIFISPWLASVISAIIAILGSVFLCINNDTFRILGVIFIQLWLVFDCVDGNIARVTKHFSKMGDFIDTLSGYVISAFAMVGIGVAAYNTTSISFLKDNYLLVLFGCLGCIANLLTRLIHQNYVATILKLESKGVVIHNPDEDVERDHGLGYLRSRIDKEIGISGIFMPLLIIAAIFNFYDYFTIIYSIFFCLSCIAIILYYILKSKPSSDEWGENK